ncbi:MAG: glycosyltransferase family 4 protein [Bacteroidia bacterium]
MEKKKIVFLYTELASYFLACIEKLLQEPNIEVHIIRWPVNKEAPFTFSFSENIFIYDRKNFVSDSDIKKLLEQIGPDVIYSSGWVDKGYMLACKQYKKSGIPVIVGFDNQWTGSLKQQLARLISPFKILNHFSHCWVPGILQEEYALRLGFKKSNILNGFYCCDYDFFSKQYEANLDEKRKKFPKRFIFVGRYYDFKGITDLWQAFIQLQEEYPNDWELWCFGTGDLEPVKHAKIKHFGFVQPSELSSYISQTGVFVLPSHFEPWGVVMHEFATAGFPLICTDKVGARTVFLENNFNGYIYKSGSISGLKKVLKQMIGLNDTELLQMGERSREKAKQITPEHWVKQLISVT